MKVTKKITFFSFILPLCKPILSVLLLTILGLKYWIYFYQNDFIIFLLFMSVILLVFTIPSIILQFNYYIHDRKCLLTIDESIDEITLVDNNKEFTFKLSDVDRVRMVHSKNFEGGNWQAAPWGNHYFYMICLKNDDEYLVTRLMGKKLDKLLHVRIVRQKVFLPLITKYYQNRAKNK